MRDFSVTGVLAAALLALAAGCNGCQNDDKHKAIGDTFFTVTFYSGGKEASQWRSNRYTTGDGRLYFYVPEKGEPYILSGSYVLEQDSAGLRAPAQENAPAMRYRITLFDDGKAVRTFLAQRYTAGDARVHIHAPGREQIVIGGSFIVEPLEPPPASSDRPRFTVSLHSGGAVVRSWKVTRYSSGSGKLYLYLPGCREPIMVAGTVTVEPE